jgi:hypothetical protein
MDSESYLARRVGRAVIQHLTDLLGSTTVSVINSYLRLHGTDLQNIHEPHKLSQALEMIFKEGSIMIEREIAGAVYATLGFPVGTFERLEDAVERIAYRSVADLR